jgi:uncharacterized coiled-coil DUF342 family protein
VVVVALLRRITMMNKKTLEMLENVLNNTNELNNKVYEIIKKNNELIQQLEEYHDINELSIRAINREIAQLEQKTNIIIIVTTVFIVTFFIGVIACTIFS